LALENLEDVVSPGLPDATFSYQKNPNWDVFLRAFEWKMLIYFMAILNI
jgi:hypothetical protein